VNIGADMSEIMKTTWKTAGIEREIPEFELWVRPADRMCGLKAGDILYTGAPGAKAHDKMQFRLTVSLNEPGIVECQPLLESLKQFADLVGNTIATFKPCLA
jgi:hypothetical protein